MSADEPELTPPPGWVPDPSGDGSLRWWDGRQWTSDRTNGSTSGAEATDAPQQRAMAAFAHLGVPGFSVFLPLALWSSARPGSFVRAHARQAFSFQCAFLACWIVLVALMAVGALAPILLVAVLSGAFVLELPNVLRAMGGRPPMRLVPFEPLAP